MSSNSSLYTNIRGTMGRMLRALANLLTGNSFRRIERSLEELKTDLRKVRRASREARDAARRLHDAQQEAMLATYRSKLERD